jgi:hypothetical protein
MTLEKREMDISEMRESLGTIMASFTYIWDPYAIIKEIDIIMSFESAMLDVQGRWSIPIWGNDGIEVTLPPKRANTDWFAGGNNMPKKPTVEKSTKRRVKTYKELFDVERWWWESAVDSWNSQTGNWKDSIIICSRLRSDLMRIALKEQLVSLTSSMYAIQLRGAPDATGEFFDAEAQPKTPGGPGSGTGPGV